MTNRSVLEVCAIMRATIQRIWTASVGSYVRSSIEKTTRMGYGPWVEGDLSGRYVQSALLGVGRAIVLTWDL